MTGLTGLGRETTRGRTLGVAGRVGLGGEAAGLGAGVVLGRVLRAQAGITLRRELLRLTDLRAGLAWVLPRAGALRRVAAGLRALRREAARLRTLRRELLLRAGLRPRLTRILVRLLGLWLPGLRRTGLTRLRARLPGLRLTRLRLPWLRLAGLRRTGLTRLRARLPGLRRAGLAGAGLVGPLRVGGSLAAGVAGATDQPPGAVRAGAPSSARGPVSRG
ncbi:MAG TPA: hypothetical protein VG756_26960 [Pseudonocardiaceae bacterium]|nr:hypothetical protein [Pseudonocardiaceae bacterium]